MTTPAATAASSASCTAAMAGRDPCAGAQHDSTSATTPGGTPRSTSVATGGRFPRGPHTCTFNRLSGSSAVVSASYGKHALNTCHASTPKL